LEDSGAQVPETQHDKSICQYETSSFVIKVLFLRDVADEVRDLNAKYAAEQKNATDLRETALQAFIDENRTFAPAHSVGAFMDQLKSGSRQFLQSYDS